MFENHKKKDAAGRPITIAVTDDAKTTEINPTETTVNCKLYRLGHSLERKIVGQRSGQLFSQLATKRDGMERSGRDRRTE